jgi:hypothetical protein
MQLCGSNERRSTEHSEQAGSLYSKNKQLTMIIHSANRNWGG